ncbi:MAG: ABC transporter ATP-binding protein [Muribaculaceae bacterium]|nr:ABC transporter ATP-binding protein [Muribaculaceae bacterium]
MLKIENLTYSYSKRMALIENFNMNIEPGSVCGLLGKNGVGKTTLIYLICGLLKPQSGKVDFKGYTPYDRKTSFLEDVMLVPEEYALPNVTLEEYIRVNAPFYPKFDKTQLDHYLGIFELTPDLHLGKLSMGQKKKAFISVAMACNTSLLLLDEPTNGLDITSKRNFRRAIAECMSDDKIILISTHQVYDVDKILDHVVIADRHGVLLDSSINDIMDKFTFSFTTDRVRAENALIALEVPGGFNIAEPLTPDSQETDVNLETLFELVQSNQNIKNFHLS